MSGSTDHTPSDPGLVARRAAAFGAAASAYAEHRPDYPVSAVRWALEPVAGRPGRTVLDLGAGTGKLTGVLVRLGIAVTAVEPDPAMAAELRRRLPGVTVLSGTSEDIPLPDGSVDAVLAGQAFHWFDPRRALPEIARVLRPEGALAALWNDLDVRVDWVRDLDQISTSSASFGTDHDFLRLPAHDAFGSADRRVFDHEQLRTAESLTATIGTHSHTLVVSAEERALLLDRILTRLRSRPETSQGEFALPIVTTVVRRVRVSDG